MKLLSSTRLKMTVYSSFILCIVGLWSYWFDPYHIDKFAFYMINTTIPILGYIVGRSIRSGSEDVIGFMVGSSRYRLTFIAFILLVIIGVIGYVFSPEHIDKLGGYMIGVVLPLVGYVIGRSIKPNKQSDTIKDDEMIES